LDFNIQFFFWRIGTEGISILIFIKIGQKVFEISRFFIFKMAAVRHLGFLKIRKFY